MTTTFQVGTTYTTGEARDYVWRFKVLSRTAKFITINDFATGEPRRVGIRVYNDTETCLPLGSYSMAPALNADEPYTP